jgi:hypothetical protein
VHRIVQERIKFCHTQCRNNPSACRQYCWPLCSAGNTEATPENKQRTACSVARWCQLDTCMHQFEHPTGRIIILHSQALVYLGLNRLLINCKVLSRGLQGQTRL